MVLSWLHIELPRTLFPLLPGPHPDQLDENTWAGSEHQNVSQAPWLYWSQHRKWPLSALWWLAVTQAQSNWMLATGNWGTPTFFFSILLFYQNKPWLITKIGKCWKILILILNNVNLFQNLMVSQFYKSPFQWLLLPIATSFNLNIKALPGAFIKTWKQ